MAIATEREAGEAGQSGATGPGESIQVPVRLLDLLASPAMDFTTWREEITRECYRELTPEIAGGDGGLDWHGFWLHACGVGSAAARIAEATGMADARIAFAAGLLHDVGKLGLARRFPRSYARAIEMSVERGEQIYRSEAGLFGIDHTLAGRRMAEEWCLPRSIVDAIWLHHQPAESLPDRSTREVVLVVATANALAMGGWAGWGSQEDGWIDDGDAVGLSAKTLEDIKSKLPEDVVQLAKCLDDGWPETSAAEASARALSAIRHLTRSVRPGMAIAELCAGAADAVVCGLKAPAACVIAAADGSDLLEIGSATADGRTWDRLPMISDGSPMSEVSVMHACGARLVPIPPQCAAILERFCGAGSGAAEWAMALMDGGRVVGALLLRAGAALVRELAGASAASDSLIAVIQALLGQAVAASANASRGEELALGARRLDDAGRAAVGERSAAAMSEFASGAAHELNTPLAVIRGRADQLLSWELDPELERAVSAIREHVGLCAEIVNELAAFAEPAAPTPGAVDVGALLTSVRDASIASGEFGAAECCVEISDELPRVSVDANQLHAIIRELLSNAIEATAGRQRRLTIKAARHRTDEQVVISVADNGRGMEPDVRERAFDPFFSRRPAGRGRGLGLSRVRRLATLNGGQVRLRSEVDRGTVVEVTLPVSRIE